MMTPFESATDAFRKLLTNAGCSEEKADELLSLVRCLQGTDTSTKNNISLASELLGYCSGEGGGSAAIASAAPLSFLVDGSQVVPSEGNSKHTLFNSTDVEATVTIATNYVYLLLPNAVQETEIIPLTDTDTVGVVFSAAPTNGGKLVDNIEILG